MKHTTRLLKVTAVICLGTLLPGLLHATVIRQAFSYDASGRLTGVTVADRSDAGERYRYDASGNITEKSVNGETVIMTYDAANQLQTRTDLSGTTRFVYDNAGRLVEERRDGEAIARYEYGYLDKVTSVTRDGVVTNFHYNARGMLVAKEREGKIIETLGWDGIGLVARGDTVFANEAHISGGVPLVATTSDGSEASYFDSDYLGTTTASYTADGEVNAYVQGSFGQGTEFADARFTGKHYDADLGAHVFPFRNYRSDAGRWTSADPAGFPDGPNQHFYAPVPTMGLDPWGLEETQWIYSSYTIKRSWTEEKKLALNPSFSVSFPWGASVSVSPGITWNKIGSISTHFVEGTQPNDSDSLLPEGWGWVPETITPGNAENVISIEDSIPTYGSAYEAQSGVYEYEDWEGQIQSYPVYWTFRDGSLSGTYFWRRQAVEL